jgi:uncharacterized protein YciI
MPLFAVIRTRGAAWQADRTPEEQDAYRPHATHMNQLYEEGAVVLGGWLDDTGDVLLIMRAANASEVRGRLHDDPWTALDILPVSRVAPWSLALGTLSVADALADH